MTEVAQIQQSNQVLLATVRAGDEPQIDVVVNTNAFTGPPTPGQRWFVKTGVSQAINEADGCVIAPQIAFEADTPVIYATLRAYNVEAGTRISAQWAYEGSEVHTEGFNLNRSSSEICIWFSLDQTTAEFLPGNWTVRLFADGAQLESPMPFSIREPAAMAEG
jgi:hypothetical protein